MIVIEQSNEPPQKRPLAAYRALKGLGIPKDILVLTREEFDKTAGDPSSLCALVLAKGILLYDAA